MELAALIGAGRVRIGIASTGKVDSRPVGRLNAGASATRCSSGFTAGIVRVDVPLPVRIDAVEWMLSLSARAVDVFETSPTRRPEQGFVTKRRPLRTTDETTNDS